MKLKTFEYRVSSTKIGNVERTIIAEHADGEVHRFHVCPSGTPGKITFMSRDVISRMRAGDSVGARALMNTYKAIFAVHAEQIEAAGNEYQFLGFSSEAP